MNKFMNLIGVKARNALKIKIDTKIKNKVLNDYALLLDKAVSYTHLTLPTKRIV